MQATSILGKTVLASRLKSPGTAPRPLIYTFHLALSAHIGRQEKGGSLS